MQAGPETLMMAIAARPGALERANIVGSSFVKVAKALFRLLLGEGKIPERSMVFSGHIGLTTVDIHRQYGGENECNPIFLRAVHVTRQCWNTLSYCLIAQSTDICGLVEYDYADLKVKLGRSIMNGCRLRISDPSARVRINI